MNYTITRRQFLQGAAGAALATVATGYYAREIEPRWVEFVKRPLPIPHLPANLVGKTLVQISDMHITEFYAWEYQIDELEYVKSLSPDFVVYTGDYVTYQTANEYSLFRTVQEHMPLGSLGTAAILGNHDYGLDWSQTHIADAITDMLTEYGITVLRNQTQSFAGLNITGLDDFWGPNFAPEPVIAAIEPDQPSLVLCHNPDVMDQPVWGDYKGWVLAGHTHGGQVKPPFLPPPIVPVYNLRYSAGKVDLKDGRLLYVSRGLGNLWQVRFNVRPEITIFTLAAV